MAVKNEIPTILTLRDNLEANYKEQTKHWIDVYNVVLAVGELFSNHTSDDPKEKISLESAGIQDPSEASNHLILPIDVGAFPERMLGKCLWGASYSAILASSDVKHHKALKLFVCEKNFSWKNFSFTQAASNLIKLFGSLADR